MNTGEKLAIALAATIAGVLGAAAAWAILVR
jgi:hypothetical protein